MKHKQVKKNQKNDKLLDEILDEMSNCGLKPDMLPFPQWFINLYKNRFQRGKMKKGNIKFHSSLIIKNPKRNAKLIGRPIPMVETGTYKPFIIMFWR